MSILKRMSRHHTLGILFLMVFLLFLNSIFSCRENYIEGLTMPDVSHNPVDVSNIVQAAASGQSAGKIADIVSQVAASGGAPVAAAPASTEGFDNIFGNHYSNATHWNNTNSNFFKNVPFRPECCNNSSISTSTGCACLPPDKARFLQHHGNND